jgi:formate C-acetyltransferase
MGLNLPKVLELVLNGGRCLITGDQVWSDVPDDFADWEDLLACYRARVRQVCQAGMEIIREDELLEPGIYPRPWLTLLSRGGIEDAVDVTAGQPRYDIVGVTLCGLADIANSLHAVRRLVYEDGRLTLPELREVLRTDWQGQEDLRQFVINRLPRFGQDDADVDAIAAAEAAHYAACFEGEKTAYGGPFCPMIFGVSTSLTAYKAPKTGATPSGRRGGDPLSMSLQPSTTGPQGTATAVLHSSCAVDARLFAGGISNVQECDPVLVSGEGGLERLGDLVRGFLDSGGMELSLNFLDEATLRAAQSEPEHYPNLTVRLFGLSAHFVDLSPEVQEEIIQRVAAAGRRAG